MKKSAIVFLLVLVAAVCFAADDQMIYTLLGKTTQLQTSKLDTTRFKAFSSATENKFKSSRTKFGQYTSAANKRFSLFTSSTLSAKTFRDYTSAHQLKQSSIAGLTTSSTPQFAGVKVIFPGTTAGVTISAASGTQTTINNVATGAGAVLDFNQIPASGSDVATLRFFRATNTSGLTSLQILKGDNTNTINNLIAGNGSSYFAASTGNVCIGTASCSTKFTVLGNGSVSGTMTVGSGTNTVYYCNAGTNVGLLGRGNGGPCPGGAWVATSLVIN